MRLVLYNLCVFIILLASALFISGYDGTQIREFLLGVAAIMVVALRILKPAAQSKASSETAAQSEVQREQRLSARDVAPNIEDEYEYATRSSQRR